MANNPNVGPDPVEADPNHVREKTYEAPVVPKPYADQREALPETTAAEKVREELPEAIGAIKKAALIGRPQLDVLTPIVG